MNKPLSHKTPQNDSQALLNCIVFLWAPCNFFRHTTFFQCFSNTDDIRRQSRTLYIALLSIGQKQQLVTSVSCDALSLSLVFRPNGSSTLGSQPASSNTSVLVHLYFAHALQECTRQVVCLSKPRIKNSTDVFRRIKTETVRHYGTLRFNHAV